MGLINAAQQLENEYRYIPFGEVQVVKENVGQPLGFAAREWDSIPGLCQVRARWYDPQSGRFVSEDPIGLAGGINPYRYAGNDPVNKWDPSGTCEEWHTIETTIHPSGVVTTRTIRIYFKGDDCHMGGGGGGGGKGASEGRRFDRCAVAGFLNEITSTLKRNPLSFWPDYPDRFDYKAIDLGDNGSLKDRYQVGGRWLRSDEFGNFAAGYAGESAFGPFGQAAMHLGGVVYANKKDSNEDPLDLASAPMINAGARRADRDHSAARSALLRHGIAPPAPLTDLTGCATK